jgi:DNA polymerase-3 subunit epsilon
MACDIGLRKRGRRGTLGGVTGTNREFGGSMILELDRPLVCVDFETTGLDTSKDRIVEIGLVRLMPNGTRQEFQRRVDPGIDIPESATRIHGIRNDDVRGLFGEPTLARIGKEIVEFMGESDLAGFNLLQFDLPLWESECQRHGLEFSAVNRRIVDAKLIFEVKEIGWDRFLQGPKNLNNAVLHYCGREQAVVFASRDGNNGDAWVGQSVDEQHRHSAVKDAAASLDVLLAQLYRYPDLPRGVAGLYDFCRSVLEERTHGNRLG